MLFFCRLMFVLHCSGADSLSRWELARWNLALRVVQMRYNRTVHPDLGVSPNEMMGLSSWRGCYNGG